MVTNFYLTPKAGQGSSNVQSQDRKFGDHRVSKVTLVFPK